jgi:outer membrane protein assembly factor BamE (lipoprotein component of BamABCDE complex)
MNKLTAFSLFILVFLFVGCGTPRLTPASLSQLKEGVSTRLDVEKLLGKPDNVVAGANLKTLTSYRDIRKRGESSMYSSYVHHTFRTAYFLFEPEGLLEKQLISDTLVTEKFNGITQTRTAGNLITSDKISKIIPKLSTYKQVRELLGSPTSEALTIDSGVFRDWTYIRDPLLSRVKAQIIQASFDETDLLIDFVVKDEIPEDKKHKYLNPFW